MESAQRRVDLSGAAAVDVHLLQSCSIAPAGEGPAQVTGYFKIAPTGQQSDGLDVLQSSFRGRTLMGVELPLPEGYSGAVVQRQEATGATAAGWRATGVFDALRYWNHDTIPLASDGVRRGMEWAALSGRVHAPLSPAEVEQALAAGTPSS